MYVPADYEIITSISDSKMDRMFREMPPGIGFPKNGEYLVKEKGKKKIRK